MIAVEFESLVCAEAEDAVSAIYSGEIVAVAILPSGSSREDRHNFRRAMTGLLRVAPSVAGAAWGDGETVRAMIRRGTGLVLPNPRPYLGRVGCGAGDVLTVCRKLLKFPVDRVVGPEFHRKRWEEAGVAFEGEEEYLGGGGDGSE